VKSLHRIILSLMSSVPGVSNGFVVLLLVAWENLGFSWENLGFSWENLGFSWENLGFSWDLI
jgi:hypothetical protein